MGGNANSNSKGNGKMASADVAQQPQGSTIFVQGFNYDTDEEAVTKHFGAVGAIKELHFQGRGAAVITYKKSSAATRAVNELHETTLEGQSRYVVVKMDDPDRESEGDKGKVKGKDEGKTKGSGKVGSRPPGRTIFVIGFDSKTDDDAFMNHFATVGAIEDHHFQSRRSAIITYVKASSAQRAITDLDGSIMSGQTRYLEVKLDEPDGNGGEQLELSAPAKGSGKKRKGTGKV